MPTLTLLHLIILITGVTLGSAATYCLMSIKQRYFTQDLNHDLDAANAVLNERLRSFEDQALAQKDQTLSLIDSLEIRTGQFNRLQGESLVQKEKIKELELRLQEAKKHGQEKLDFITGTRTELTNSFKSISSDIFKNNSEQFIHIARETMTGIQEKSKTDLDKRSQAIGELLHPIKTAMENVDGQIKLVEKERTAAYASLSEQIKGMLASQNQLQHETSNLIHALRTPAIRGRWGEVQLKRVVEMAGMLEYCDFITQEHVATENGSIRPDLVIKLPNNKTVVVDSKAVLQAYIEASEATDEAFRTKKLQQHAAQIRTQLKNLATKAYWQQFEHSPEFVVLFLPGENFFSAALEQDPQLIEFGISQKVIIATPTTLIALLKAVSYGWRQETITKNAKKIGQLGKTLYDRIAILSDHFVEIRKGLDRTILAYNNAVGSFESRVLVSARKFKELDPVITKEINTIEAVDRTARQCISTPHSEEQEVP